MEQQRKVTRILDYEFLGIFSPEQTPDLEYLQYQLWMEDGSEGLCFFPFKENQTLLKGDVVEYYEKTQGRLVVSLPKKKQVFIKHNRPNNEDTPLQ
mgnify:CR=1 FL=1